MYKMEGQEIEGSDLYILGHLRYMCEFVMINIRKCEDLLETNENAVIQSKILDLISFIEEKCQAYKRSSKEFHQNLESRNEERSSLQNTDFHRPLSQIYKNELYNNANLNFLHNEIKQESDEIGEVTICENHERNAETKNHDSSTNFCKPSGKKCLNPFKDAESEETLDTSMSCLSKNQANTVQANINAEKVINQNNIEKSTSIQNMIEDIWQQDTRDGLLELLTPISQLFCDDSSTIISLDNTHMYENNIENKDNYPVQNSPFYRRPNEKCIEPSRNVKSERKLQKSLSSISNHPINNLERNNPNINTAISKSSSGEYMESTYSDAGSQKRFEETSAITNGKVFSNEEKSYSNNLCDEFEKDDENLSTDQLIEELNEIINSTSSKDESSTSKILCIKRKNEISEKKNPNSRFTSTHRDRTSIHKIEANTKPKISKKKFDISFSQEPSLSTNKIDNKIENCSPISDVTSMHTYPSSPTTGSENGEIFGSQQGVDADQCLPSIASIAKVDGNNKIVSSANAEEQLISKDSVEEQAYIQDEMRIENQTNPVQANINAEKEINQNNAEKSTSIQNMIEDIWQQDTRDGLLELLPPLSQPFLDDSSTIISLDNRHTHEKNVENKDNYPVQNSPFYRRSNIKCKEPSRDVKSEGKLQKSLSSISKIENKDKQYSAVDVSTSESPIDLSTFSDTKSNTSTKHSYTEQEVQEALKELDLISTNNQLSPWSTCSLDSVLNSKDSTDSIDDSFDESRSESSLNSNYIDHLLDIKDFGGDTSDSSAFSEDTMKDDCSLPSFSVNIGNEGERLVDRFNIKDSGDFINESHLMEYYEKNNNIKNCSVIVQRLAYSKYRKQITDLNFLKNRQNTYTTDEKDEDNEIKRLCQINSLDGKHSQNSVDSNAMKEMKETNSYPMENSLHETSDELIIEDCLEMVDEHNELGDIESNKYLADIVCETIEDVDDQIDSDVESNGEIYTTKDPNLKRSTKKSEIKSDNVSADKEKNSWKDPLLTCKLGVNENPMAENAMENDLNNDVDCTDYINIEESDNELSCGSESSTDEISEEMNMEHAAGDSDEILEILENPTNTQMQSVQDSEEDRQSDPKKGRKNIKSVLTYEELTEATKSAEKEEEHRSLRIQQRQHLFSSHLNEEDVFILDSTNEGEAIVVDPLLNRKLYPHQREGVKFMWQSCYESVERLQHSPGLGCILAHCMGLGKTFQVFTLIHTLFSHPITNMKHCMIICPVSTVIPWKKEIESGLELSLNKINITVEHIEGTDSIVTKCVKIKKWRKQSGILLMGYEAFGHLISGKSVEEKVKNELSEALLDPGPDLVICDEGHLLKNKNAKKTQALSKIRTRRRIILTGTPMQNNLSEYYCMVNFVNPNILGTFKEYNNRFVNPITNGQYSDSTLKDINVMKKRTHVLHGLLRNTIQRYEVSELNKYLKPIKNYTIFTKLHPVQSMLYQYFIESAEKHFIRSSGKSTNLFHDINVAKYICSHPHMLSIMVEQIKLRKNRKDLLSNGEKNVLDVKCFEKDWWKKLCSEDDLYNIDCGPKLKLTLAVIEEAEKLGEKVLIFTSSLVELESLEYFLKKVGTSCSKDWRHEVDYFRMDGSVQSAKRANMCSHFNDPENKRLRVLLISFNVGGVGLSLTAANRVVILGSVFNPVHDTQSVYRCYRFGQTKTVYIYRLISMGTMEEKIYRRCVSKLALACRVVDKQQIGRHFDLSGIKKLYKNDVKLDIPKKLLNKPDDKLLATLISKFDFLHDYVDHQGLLENKPEDDLNDEEKERAWEEFKKECENPPSQQRLVEMKTEEAITNLVSTDSTPNTTPSNIKDLNAQVPANHDDTSHPVVDMSTMFNDTNQSRDDYNAQSMQVHSSLTSSNDQQCSKKRNANVNILNVEIKSFGENNVTLMNEGVSNKYKEKEVNGVMSKKIEIQRKMTYPQHSIFSPKFSGKIKSINSKKRFEENIASTIENSNFENLSSFNQKKSDRNSKETSIQHVTEQLQNLRNISIYPVDSPNAKTNPSPKRKENESFNSKIFHRARNVGNIRVSNSNSNSFSTHVSSGGKVVQDNKNQDSVNVIPNKISPNSTLASVDPTPTYNSYIHSYTQKSVTTKERDNIQNSEVNNCNIDTSITKKFGISGHSSGYSGSKVFKTQKLISTKSGVAPRSSLKQMHNMNKPQNNIESSRRVKSPTKKVVGKRKSDVTNTVAKNNNQKNISASNNETQCKPSKSVEKSAYPSTSGNQTKSNNPQKSVKRSYPYSSDEIQHSPLDLRKKPKKNESIESFYNRLMINHDLYRRKLAATKHKINNSPGAYFRQKSKEAVRNRKRKLPRSGISKSLSSNSKEQRKKTNDLSTEKLSTLNSKRSNLSYNDRNKISERHPTIVSSQSNEKVSSLPMIGSCRISRISKNF